MSKSSRNPTTRRPATETGARLNPRHFRRVTREWLDELSAYSTDLNGRRGLGGQDLRIERIVCAKFPHNMRRRLELFASACPWTGADGKPRKTGWRDAASFCVGAGTQLLLAKLPGLTDIERSRQKNVAAESEDVGWFERFAVDITAGADGRFRAQLWVMATEYRRVQRLHRILGLSPGDVAMLAINAVLVGVPIISHEARQVMVTDFKQLRTELAKRVTRALELEVSADRLLKEKRRRRDQEADEDGPDLDDVFPVTNSIEDE